MPMPASCASGTPSGIVDDCVQVFEALSAEAEAPVGSGTRSAISRIAEFFTAPRSTGEGRALPPVPRSVRCRGRRTADSRDTPSPTPARSCPPTGYPQFRVQTHGAVLLHGGFDSLIEEFFAIWQRIAAAGFDVIAFDGPGQGGARDLGGLTFDHDWEKPVGAILDHFALDSAALVGISMGGYWALRAAGREPRIDRVVVLAAGLRLAAPRPGRRPRRRPQSCCAAGRFMRWSVRVRTRLVADPAPGRRPSPLPRRQRRPDGRSSTGSSA